MKCLSCGSKNMTFLYDASDFDKGKENYSLFECDSCFLAQTYPLPTETLLSNYYNTDYYGSCDSKFSQAIESWTRFSAKNRAKNILKLHRDKTERLNILDIGCGRGTLVNAFNQLNQNAVGVERPESIFSDNPKIHCSNVDKLPYPDCHFDIVIFWHSLEHLRNFSQDLESVSKLLKPNGTLAIAVPNFGSTQASLFKQNWFHLDLPRHLVHFNKRSIAEALSKKGLYLESTSTLSVDQNIYGMIQSSLNCIPFLPNNQLYKFLKKGMSFKSSLGILIYLPIIFPLSILSILELIYSQISGRGASLIVIAKKNG